MLEQWLAGDATDKELSDAADAADAAADAAAYAADAAADRDEVLMDWLDQYLTAWQKVAADEGCLIPDDQEAEYVRFVEQLDFLASQEAPDV